MQKEWLTKAKPNRGSYPKNPRFWLCDQNSPPSKPGRWDGFRTHQETQKLAEDIEIPDASSSQPGNLDFHGNLAPANLQIRELQTLQHQYSWQSERLLEVEASLKQRTQEAVNLRRQCEQNSEELIKRQHKVDQNSKELDKIRRQCNETLGELQKRQKQVEHQSQELGSLRRQSSENSVELVKLRAVKGDNSASSGQKEVSKAHSKPSEQAAGNGRQEEVELTDPSILKSKLAETNPQLETAQDDANQLKLANSGLIRAKEAAEIKLQGVTKTLRQTEAALANATNNKSQEANVSVLVTQLHRKDAALTTASEENSQLTRDKGQLEARVSLLATQLQQQKDAAPATAPASGDNSGLTRVKGQLEANVSLLLALVKRKDAALETASREQSRLEAKASLLQTQLQQKDAALVTVNGDKLGQDLEIRGLKSRLQEKDAALAKASEEKRLLEEGAKARSTAEGDNVALQKTQSELETTMAKPEEDNEALKGAVKAHQPWYGTSLTIFDFLSSREKSPEQESSTTPAEDSRNDLIAKYNDLLSGKTRNQRLARAREQRQQASSPNPPPPPPPPGHEGSEDGWDHDEFITALTIDVQISKTVMRNMTGRSDNAKRMVATTLLGLPRPVIDKISADPAAAVAALTEKPIEGPTTDQGSSTELEVQEEGSAVTSSSPASSSSSSSSSSSPEGAESLPEKEEESLPAQTVRPEGTCAPIARHLGAIGANETWSLNEKMLFSDFQSCYAACATFSCGASRKPSIPWLRPP